MVVHHYIKEITIMKMKKLVLATVLATVFCATPVLATETNLNAECQAIGAYLKATEQAIDPVLKSDDVCTGSKPFVTQLANNFAVQVNNNTKVEEEKYIYYLQRILVNKQAIKTVKEQRVAILKEAVALNPALSADLAAAEAEVAQANAEIIAANQAIANAQIQFAAMNLQIQNNFEVKRANAN